MEISSKQKTGLAIVLGAAVAIAPAFFGYLQTSQEIRAKYAENHRDAAGGYDALAAAVKDLQAAALEQHDYIVKLEGQIVILTGVLTRQLAAAGGPLRMQSTLPSLDKPPARPDLPAPPGSFDAAVIMAAP